MDLFFAWDAASDSLCDHKRFLAADRVRHTAGLGFGHCAAGLDRNPAGTFFGHHAADLVRNSLNDLLTDHATRTDRNLFDNLLGHDTADLDRNLGDDRFADLAADSDWHNLLANRGLIGRARNLAFDDVWTPDRTAGVEATWNHGHAGVAAFVTHTCRVTETLVPGSLDRPASTVLANSSVRGDGLHHGVAAFLINRFADIPDDVASTFAFNRFGHWSLNATADFASGFFPDRSLHCVSAFAVLSFGHRPHHGVSLFAIRRLDDLASNLVLLFAVRRFDDVAIAGLLHVFVGSLVHRAAHGVGLRFLHVVIDRALTLLPFDPTCRVTCRRLAGCRWAAAVTGCSTVTPGPRGLWWCCGDSSQRSECANHPSVHDSPLKKPIGDSVMQLPRHIPTGIAYVDSSV